VAITSTGLVAETFDSLPRMSTTAKAPHYVVGTKAIISATPEIDAIFETDHSMTIPKIIIMEVLNVI
jgi:hypothetical protein